MEKKRERGIMDFLKHKFSMYYSNPDIVFPPKAPSREYGFLFFDSKMMSRHISFATEGDLLKFLSTKIPAHAYYSSAYYEDPGASSMGAKGWLGADLIFDLDADHLPGAEKMSYEETLGYVKDELVKLVSFLVDDFGFDSSDLRLFFSGGRGYHCHVTHPKVLQLGNHERREIVDFITGRGLETKAIFRERVVERSGPEGQYARKRLEIPHPTEGGWKGRISRGILEIIERIKGMEEEHAVQYLVSFAGITEKVARDFLRDISDEKIGRIREGILDQSTSIRKIFLRGAIRLSAMYSAGTDEPVTSDTRRLIRLPGSLHGKTGLKVTRVSLDELKSFDPLQDAVVFGGDPVRVDIKKPVTITLKGERFSLDVGQMDVPEYLAIFLMARGAAVTV